MRTRKRRPGSGPRQRTARTGGRLRSTEAAVLELQRLAGNTAVTALLASPVSVRRCATGPGCDHDGAVQRSAGLTVQRTARPLLRRGSKGSGVRDLQSALEKQGFGPGRPDGDFGARTDKAVRAFQRKRGLAADGVVGARTWAALGAAPASPGGAGPGGATAPATPPAVEPAPGGPTSGGGADGATPGTTEAAASEPGGVRIGWGGKARQDTVAASSLGILRGILAAAGLEKATITSTARTAADQARAMYNNLVGTGAGKGVAGQRRLYGPAGNQVITTFVQLRDRGLSAQEIRDGMRDKILAIGPSRVSRHCGDPAQLNVFDVGPNSLGGDEAKRAFAVAAAQAESSGRVSKFIPWPKDPGHHLEIKP